MQFDSSVSIAAPPGRVWAIVDDLDGDPAWDSGVIATTGTIADGARLSVVNEVAPKRRFSVRVVEYEPPRRMVWRGGMPFGLFVGVRTFELAPDGDGTRFTMSERYRGPMLRLIRRSMPDLQPSFDRFTCGLRIAAERAEGAPS